MVAKGIYDSEKQISNHPCPLKLAYLDFREFETVYFPILSTFPRDCERFFIFSRIEKINVAGNMVVTK